MRLRAPSEDDAPAVFAVLAARDTADLGIPDYTLEDVLDEWRVSELDLSADTCVVELDDRIVAYSIVRRPGSLAVVAPMFEGRGIGARLLRWTEACERKQGRESHRQWIANANQRGRALLRDAGYTHVRS